MTKRAELKQVSPSCVIVSGFETRSLVTEVAGRPPVYNATDRGWVIQPHRVPDFVALAEQRGYEVLLSAELRNALQLPTDGESRTSDISTLHDGGQSDEVLPW